MEEMGERRGRWEYRGGRGWVRRMGKREEENERMKVEGKRCVEGEERWKEVRENEGRKKKKFKDSMEG